MTGDSEPVTPHRRSLRHPLAATTALLLIALGTLPASAQPAPPPTSSQDPMQRYQELGAQAAKADEDLLTAQDQLNARQADRDKANADVTKANDDLGKAQAAIAQFRPQVDTIALSALDGGQLNDAAMLLDSGNRQEFLDRASALSMLADRKSVVLGGLRDAVNQAQNAKTAAANAQKTA